MKRWQYWRSIWLMFILLVTVQTEAAVRNVVLFIADDVGLQAGCYGHPVVKTPHLDALAKQGTRFPFAFCTTASCSPSRAVILTGLHNHANGQYGLEHGSHGFESHESVRSLPVILKEQGYRTMRIGRSRHVGPEKNFHFDQTVPAGGPLTMDKRLYGRNPVQCAKDSRKFLGEDSSTPFFLMFCTSDAHRFMTTLKKLPGAPNGFANDHKYPGVTEKTYSPDQVVVPAWLPDTLETRAELAQYYQAVSRIDQGLGKLVEALKETGHWEDTLLIVISDHGPPFPGAKTTVYEPGLRCPCVVRNPLIEKRGVTSQAMVSWVDIAPTILEYCGIDPSERRRMHGRSLLSVLEQQSPQGWDTVFASHTFHEVTMYYPMRVVRERRYKLIWNIAHKLDFPLASDLWNSSTWQKAIKQGPDSFFGKRTMTNYLHRPEFELYDLKTDPDEARNLSEHPDYLDIRNNLQKKLVAFQKKTKDPWLLKWKHE